ncbi:OmpA family protein [candidate division KSB1 bacterium]|nr:OmpA family protein [candidate division KSB1 bacterium]
MALNKKSEAFEMLRDILLKKDQENIERLRKELHALEGKITDNESLITTLEPVIADLMERKIVNSRDEMAEALAPIMGEAIRHQISDAKEDIVDALYPIIGKTIRKSVAEAMKKLVDTVNQKIDQTFRSKIFRQKITSRITGVPDSQLAVRDALPFHVEEIFCIHRESGLLIAHESANQANASVDENLIAGMLTAIRAFGADTLKTENPQEIMEIQYEEYKIIVEIGLYSYLGIIISGIAPPDLKDELQKLDRKIHNHYHKILRNYDGEITQFGEITKLFRKFINHFNISPTPDRAKKTKSYFAYLLIILAVLILMLFSLIYIKPYINYYRLKSTFMTQVNKTELANQPIKYQKHADRLIISGTVASLAMKDSVNEIIRKFPNSAKIENRLSITDIDLLEKQLIHRINQKFTQKNHLPIRNPVFQIQDGALVIEGEVEDITLKRAIGFFLDEITDYRIILNLLKVIPAPGLSVEQAKAIINQMDIYFAPGDSLIQVADIPKLDSLVKILKNFDHYVLLIKGYSDSLANPAFNFKLSQGRSKTVTKYLLSQNIPEKCLKAESHGISSPIAPNTTIEGRAKNRRVEFELIHER